MSDAPVSQLPCQPRRISLFDSSGLPWTAHLSLGWIIFIFAVTGGLAAIPIGLCLGAWIRAKTRSAVVLLIYMLLAVACAAAFLPDSVMTQQWTDVLGSSLVVLWFAGALIARRQIAQYYTQREGSKFALSLGFTLLFGVWYLNYRIRPEFPSA
jgi:succinate dehydrogenase hydrophobic anchor subunit